MSERLLKEDDMGWIAIRVLASLLHHREEIELIPKNLQEITENNPFVVDIRFYTGGYQEKELVQFFKRLEEFNIPPGLSWEEMFEAQERQIDESYGEKYDPDDLPF